MTTNTTNSTGKSQSGLGIAGMVLGIIALLLSCILIGGFIGILGLILSLIGMTQKDRNHGMAIAGIVLNAVAVIIMILIFAAGSSVGSSQPANSVREAVESAQEEEKDFITYEEFDSIENGMTYEQVVDIVGYDGTVMSSVDLANINTTMYCWYGVDGITNANVTFQNNAVVSKAQFGLK
ncbi:MAG: hypothetical protein NC399_02925 [Muribaculum sp.]|nr:hypothetical protein [Muribaculum sp.]